MTIFGLVLDYYIIDTHYSFKPHPKYMLTAQRRFWIFLHVVGGSVELFCLCTAFFSAKPSILATVASIAALAAHVPSSLSM